MRSSNVFHNKKRALRFVITFGTRATRSRGVIIYLQIITHDRSCDIIEYEEKNKSIHNVRITKKLKRKEKYLHSNYVKDGQENLYNFFYQPLKAFLNVFNFTCACFHS